MTGGNEQAGNKITALCSGGKAGIFLYVYERFYIICYIHMYVKGSVDGEATE